MRCMKRVLSLFLAVCLLCSTCKGSVLAAENEFNSTVTGESGSSDNPDKTTENLEETAGIVLIDEIDMHLHPKWQWNIVNALQETFPNIQFILATHSPIVISSCKNEQLIMIAEDQEVIYLENAYGYSVQDVLNFRQGTTEKPREIKELSSQFADAIEHDELEKAKIVIKKMTEILGEDHADVCDARAELQLNTWEEE